MLSRRSGTKGFTPDLSAAFDVLQEAKDYSSFSEQEMLNVAYYANRMREAKERASAYSGRSSGGKTRALVLMQAGHVPVRYVWRSEGNAFERGDMRAQGMHGFCNRGARKAAERARKLAAVRR